MEHYPWVDQSPNRGTYDLRSGHQLCRVLGLTVRKSFTCTALHGGEPGEAFTRLVDESQRRNIKLRDVAFELLARLKVSL